eukprot:1498467-Pyramimonas_sp.AAC.1
MRLDVDPDFLHADVTPPSPIHRRRRQGIVDVSVMHRLCGPILRPHLLRAHLGGLQGQDREGREQRVCGGSGAMPLAGFCAEFWSERTPWEVQGVAVS